MKKTFKNSALLAILSLGILNSSSVLAAESSATSINTIEFIHDGSKPTNPLDPSNPDNPHPSDPIDPDDPNNNGTGNTGPLTIDYVSNINFGKAYVNGDSMSLKAINHSPFVQVSDWRDGDNGWKLTTAMTKPFTNKENGFTLDGAVMKWNDGVAKTKAGNSSVAPTTSDFSVDKDGAATTVMSAAANQKQGHGTWLDTFTESTKADSKQVGAEVLGSNEKITLDVPSEEIQNGKYTAELTWTLTDTPN